jgi:hypothetical protein
MEPLSRRNFVKGLGISGLFLAGVAGYEQAKERIVYKQDELPTAELEKQLEGKPVLQLMATYGEELPPPTYSYNGHPYLVFHSGPQYKEGTKKEVNVRMVPGPDGKLYVKENDTWRKI